MKPVIKIFILGAIWGFFSLGSFLSEPSYAIIRSNGADDQDYIDYGNLFDSTVALAYTDEKGRWFRGSSVVIDDGHWVLTAAHCILDGSGREEIGDSYTIITGPNPWDLEGRQCLVADQWWVHPDYVSISNGPDLALLYFEEAITGLTPATRFRGTDTMGSRISIVGFGDAGTPATGWLDGVDEIDDNVRRGCQAPIVYGLGSNTGAGATFSSSGGTLSGKAAHGDSGGAWYIDYEGMQQLMGITSSINGGSSYGTTWATRVSLFNDWVDGIQATMVPEPSAILLLVMGGVTVFFVTRKRASVASHLKTRWE